MGLGVIEFVRDAGTMRVELLPSHQYITLMLAGIKVCYWISSRYTKLFDRGIVTVEETGKET